ncbi:MAG: PepSY domain-containing protein [Bdellovibrionales bacterium]|nr:PepSY domain-containing protein [Bdellovibrionales bacterium]
MRFKNQLLKKFYAAHIYAGLFVLGHLVVLSLTGALLLFQDELQGETNSVKTPAPPLTAQATGYQRVAYRLL